MEEINDLIIIFFNYSKCQKYWKTYFRRDSEVLCQLIIQLVTRNMGLEPNRQSQIFIMFPLVVPQGSVT